MKSLVFSCLAAASLVASPALADITCLFSESTIHTSQDRHCPSDCGGWAERQPNIRIELPMPEEWAERGAFFRDARAACAGVGCPWAVINSVSISGAGQKVIASYRNWGRQIEVTVQAEVCVLQ